MKKRRILFNDNWRFTLTEPDSDGKTLENAHWYNVEIPHDWLIGDTANLYKSGCGWYETVSYTHLTLPTNSRV